MHQSTDHPPAPLRHVFYSGPNPAPVAASLAPLDGQIAFRADASISEILLAAARHRADIVILDLATPDAASLLLIDALATAARPPHVIVLARPRDAERHLRRPPVRSAVTLPLMPRQLRDAVMRPEIGQPDRSLPLHAGPPWLVRRPEASSASATGPSPLPSRIATPPV